VKSVALQGGTRGSSTNAEQTSNSDSQAQQSAGKSDSSENNTLYLLSSPLLSLNHDMLSASEIDEDQKHKLPSDSSVEAMQSYLSQLDNEVASIKANLNLDSSLYGNSSNFKGKKVERR
jgi:hypothetical protein